MADALTIMESLRAGRIEHDHAVLLLMYEARWPEEAAVRGVYGRRQEVGEIAQLSKAEPCGCEDEVPPPDQVGSIEDLIGALQQQVAAVEQEAAELKADAMTHEPVTPAEGGPIQ